MKRFSLKIVVGLLTFILGVTASVVWVLRHSPPVEPPPQPELLSWTMKVSTYGGELGHGSGDITVTSEGDVTLDLSKLEPNNVRTFRIPAEHLRSIEKRVLSAEPSLWKAEYETTHLYCDPCKYVINVLELRERRSDGLERAYITSWSIYSGGLPRDLAELSWMLEALRPTLD